MATHYSITPAAKRKLFMPSTDTQSAKRLRKYTAHAGMQTPEHIVPPYSLAGLASPSSAAEHDPPGKRKFHTPPVDQPRAKRAKHQLTTAADAQDCGALRPRLVLRSKAMLDRKSVV